MLNGAEQAVGWVCATGLGLGGCSMADGVRGSPHAPLPLPQSLFLFSWTQITLVHEKRLWGALGLITSFVPSCDNGPWPIAQR